MTFSLTALDKLQSRRLLQSVVRISSDFNNLWKTLFGWVGSVMDIARVKRLKFWRSLSLCRVGTTWIRLFTTPRHSSYRLTGLSRHGWEEKENIEVKTKLSWLNSLDTPIIVSTLMSYDTRDMTPFVSCQIQNIFFKRTFYCWWCRLQAIFFVAGKK